MSTATIPTRYPAQTADAQVAERLPWFLGILVLLCLVQFSSAWYWPSHPEFGDMNSHRFAKEFGVLFRYPMWCLISGVVLLHVLRNGFGKIVTVLAPWLPFWFVGVLAGIVGFDPVASMRLLVFWLVMAVIAAVAGIELTPRQALGALIGSLLALLAVSAALAVLLPNAGTQSYGHSTVWSGVFISKNELGWVAAFALTLGLYGVAERSHTKLSACLLVLAVICLVQSQSKGSLLAAAAGAAYMCLLACLAKRFSEALSAMMAIAIVLAGLVLGRALLPMLLDLLGRDATLTGRTDVWDVYLTAMMKTPWLGQGPGAFTGLSPITEKVAQMLADVGAIYTPHSMFLGAFGDAGILGLAAFCGSLLYVGLVDPMRDGTLLSKALAGMCVVTVVGGMVETHEVYNSGAGGFLLVFTRAILIRTRDEVPAGETPTSLPPRKVDP